MLSQQDTVTDTTAVIIGLTHPHTHACTHPHQKSSQKSKTANQATEKVITISLLHGNEMASQKKRC